MLRKFLFTILALTILISQPLIAETHPPHVHGQAKLDVSLDGSILTIVLDSPVESFVGFEHVAQTKTEKLSIDLMAEKLRNSEQLFITQIAAGCKQKSVVLSSPLLNDKENSSSSGHFDINAEYIFKCTNPRAMKQIKVNLFGYFPRLHQIDVQMLNDKGQSAIRLNQNKNVITW